MDLVHRDPRFPFLPSLPPPHSGPHHYGGEPGSMWRLCSVCVCVCVLTSCFIEEAVFACRDHYSDFLFFFCCEKRTEKKDCVNSHESVWETTSIVSGKLPYSLSKNIFWFTGKVQMRCLNQTLKSMSCHYSSQQKPLSHYRLLCVHIICSTFFP